MVSLPLCLKVVISFQNLAVLCGGKYLFKNAFFNVCATFKINGVTDDAIRLRLFSFSVKDKAQLWLASLPNESITTWDQLKQAFLHKYFSPH